ncbi:hypothetical protein SpAn4DRAFT_2785 [Sporomusa ovata]|uniref:Uncharacterized protein n=1 Tax=Sporomusa ovata TaxID=2378 RepID=A0A0U1KYH3_9FIRM|nr:hypothetical protein SpAn4DRAFT_2785 [Sporomusa ovata]
MTTGVKKKNKKSAVIPMNMERGGFFVILTGNTACVLH